MEHVDPLFRQVLDLPLDKRAELAARLLESLDELSDEEAQVLWASEAERRLEELKIGKARSVPATEVMRKAQSLVE
jgi:hypothetical protein